MPEEKEIVSGAENDPRGVDYIEAIKQLKDTTVPKEAYEKIQEENKKLLQSLINGETIEQESEKTDIAALRKELFGEECELSNLEYMTKIMELRSAIIEEGGTDPFLPYGKKIIPTEEDIETANRVADIINECIEYAEGDSSVFTNELQRRMIDSSPNTGRKRKYKE